MDDTSSSHPDSESGTIRAALKAIGRVNALAARDSRTQGRRRYY